MAASKSAAAVHGELLLELSFLVNERKSVDEVFASFARRLLDAADFDYTTLLIGEPDSGYMEVVASYPVELPGAKAGVSVSTRSFKYDDLLAATEGYEYTTRIESTTAASRELAAAGMSRAWVHALVSEAKVYGTLTIARKRAEAFSDDERGFLLAATRLLTAAVRQEMELAHARRAAARAEAANELALALNAGETVERSFQRLTELVTTSLAADYVGLFLDRKDGFMLVDESPRGVHQGAPPTEEGTRFILERLAATNFTQARPQKDASPSNAMFEAGYKRIGIAVLRQDETAVGLLIVGRKRSQKFNAEDQAFIELLRSMLSQSLTNTRRLERSEAEAARSRTLNEVALLLNRGEGVQAIFARLLELLDAALEADYVGLAEATHLQQGFRMIGSRPEMMRPAGEEFAYEDAAMAQVLDAKEPVVQYRTSEAADVAESNRRLVDAGLQRAAATLLREGDEVVGLLALARRRPERFDRDEVAFIETLSSMLSQAIANQRRLEGAQVAAARANVLNEAALLLKQDEPAAKVFAQVVPLLEGAMRFDYVTLLEADPTTNELVLVAAQPLIVRAPGDRIPLSHQLVAGLSRVDPPAVQYLLAQIDPSVSGVEDLRKAGMQRGVTALLRQGSETVGLFTLARRDGAPLDDEEMSFVVTLANLLGQAIANRRRLETAIRQAARSRLLNELATKLDAGESLAELFSHLPAMLPEVVQYDQVSLLTTLPGESGLRVVGASPNQGMPADGVIPWPSGPTLEALSREPMLQFEPQESQGAGGALLGRAGYRRAIAAVLRDGDQVLGSFVMARFEPRPFDPEECAFIDMLATLLSRAVANQRHLEKARTDAARTQLLNELSVLLHNGEGPEAMFNMLASRLPEQISFDSLSLLVVEGTDRLRVVDSLRRQSMQPGSMFALDDLGNAADILGGSDLVLETAIGAVTGSIARMVEEAGIRRALIAALRHNQETVGYMFVARTNGDPFTEDERTHIEILATIVAQAIANHRKLEESHAEAIRSQVLSELAVLLQEGDAISARFDRFSELLLQAVGFDHISITVRQPGSDDYQVVRSHELTLDGEPLVFDPAGIDVVMEDNRTVRQYRTADATRRVPRALAETGFQRAATAVILSSDGVEGLFTIGRTQDIRFDEKEMAFIQLVAALLGQAAANGRAAWAKAQEQEEQAIIAEAAAAVARELTGLGIVRAVRESVARFIPEAFCNFGYLEGESVVFSAPGRPRIVLPIGPGFRKALDEGFDLVPRHDDAVGSPEAQVETARTGLQSHVIASAKSGGDTVGLLIMGSRDAVFEPGEREVRLARLLADIVGPAMANVRAIERQQQEAEDQRLLAEVAAVAAREAEPAALLAALHRPMRAIVPSPMVIFGFREGEQTIFPRLDGTYSRVPLDPYLSMLDEVGQIHSDELPEDLFAESELWQMGIHAISSTAVLAAGKTVGYLMIGSRAEGYTFSRRELQLFRLLAQIVGPAMENARAAARAREDAEEQAILAEAAAALAAGASEGEVIATLTPSIRKFLPSAVATVFFLEGDVLTSPEGLGRAPFGPVAQAAMAGDQVVVEKPWPQLSSSAPAMLDAGGIERFVNTSLNAGGTSTGILFVGVRDAEARFSERDLRLIRLIADMAGPAIANARESTRRRLDAEEQRFLAETAAAAAGAATEAELVRGLARPFAQLIPGSRIDLFYTHHEGLLSAITGMVLPIGKNFRAALTAGQATAPANSTGTTSAAAVREREMGITHGISTRLSSGGQTLGLFWLGTTSDAAPTERDLRICRLVADVVGPALANLRESRRRKEDAEEQRFLAEAAAVAASASSQDRLVRELARPFQTLIPGSRIDLFYEDGDGLRSTVTGGFYPIGPHFEHALREGQRLGQPHAEGGTREAADGLARLRVIQACSTRLSSGGQTQGILWIGTTDPERLITERDLRIFRLVADVVGPALANLRESSRRKEDAEEQRFLAAVAAVAATATSEQELVRGLREPFGALTPGALISFFFRDGDGLRGPGNALFGIGPQIEEAFRTGQSIGRIDDPEVLPESAAFMRQNGICQWVNTTASSEGVTLGILHVALPDAEQVFSKRELRMYRLAADIVGPAMAHLRENARRAREADDERVLASVAAMAAVTNSPDELMERFIELLEALMPLPTAVYGHVEGDSIRYRISNPESRDLIGAADLVVPMIGASRQARATGQGHGTLADRTDQPYSPLGLQAYCVTAYHSVGSELGMLLVASRDPEYAFSETDLALLRRIAQVLGPAIEAAHAEAERARQAELYSLMLRSLSEGVILADKAGRPVFANEPGRKVLRALNPDGQAVTWEVIAELLPEEAREPYRMVFEQGQQGRGRSALTIEGQLTHIDYEFVPLNDPQMRLLVVVTDVTQDVLHEEEQQRSRDRMEQAARLAALGELIGGVAHELNNPLTAVVGFAELMSANPAAEPLAEEISVIQKEARRAADIVRDLLFIARPGTTERTKISVADLVGHIERIRRTHWIGAGIQPNIVIEPGCQVWGNEHQLTQVILNLVTNAEHALAGMAERRLSITATCVAGRTTISIADTGKGMDAATLSRIWEPFFTTKPGVGTGLGLPLSYSIIQSHNGQVVVESSPGSGTTFRIELPSGPEILESPSEQPPRDISTARVLVVDDEPSLRKVCQRLVTSLGHECETAENSAAAIAFARVRDFDLVLCDYRLATETADHVIAGFQEVAPQLVSRTVIATGATTDAGVVELTSRFGLELIAKPYGAEELSRIIAEALARAAEDEVA